MRYTYTVLFILFYCSSFSQSLISGKVVSSHNSSSLQYANVGIVNTPLSVVSNKDGKFYLKFPKEYLDSTLRFSMMGYEDYIVPIKEFKDKTDNVVSLKIKPIQLKEVEVRGNTKDYNIGTTKRSATSGFCGWGGNRRGKGHEIGLKIELGKSYVKVKKIHIRIHKISFYSCLFRLHIRRYENGKPADDLLNENILLSVNKSSGWVNFDLSSYNIVLSGQVVVTLEWIDVSDIDKNKLSRVNKSRKKTANVLISIRNNEGCLFMRRGSEAKWSNNQSHSPSIYLTVSK